ncbi:MAG: hypothetical protein HY724_05105 [Candidatus Rokubacteria bacterium]|nr:hypothetical protein [Candidatus Rokubacteria bacterium]
MLCKRERIERLVGWGLIGFAALLIPKGYLFGHAFWEESVFHKVWNTLVRLALGSNVAESAEVERALGDMPVHDPWLLYGPWAVIALLIALPILWNDWKQAGALLAHAHGDDAVTFATFIGPMLGLSVWSPAWPSAGLSSDS